MNEFPKLVIFSNNAIPRVKSTYKGATVDVYNLRNIATKGDDNIESLLNISQYFDELIHKKATVISGITDEQLTFFKLSNTAYAYLMIENENDYIILPALDDALHSLHNRTDAISQLEESTSIIFSIFKYLETLHLKRLIKKHDVTLDKAYDVSADMHYTLEAVYFGWFEVQIL
ncbi:hypothetical protein [Polynucleobacter sp. P1-05-14]|uniref:hypothetical protein n=1 Tax=Polynucleobacter sp. P1-05-14 TaxID=1819732 RepID=UPI001C0C2927|nr:hypothetical protein [Polynucleobacter sp. P1-05-14]MBU3548395.1 hypothetical protein [Polynucleobacter sp. P1-05-14]